MNRCKAQCVIAILTSCAVTPAFAGVIHKWVDDQGITHYSDEPPTVPVTEVTTIDVPEPKLTRVDSRDNYYSIANQWRRMHQESLERERLRVEAARQKAARKPDVTNVYINESDDDGYAAIYPSSYYRKHKYGHYKKHKRFSGNYPIGLHPSRWHYQGSFNQTY